MKYIFLHGLGQTPSSWNDVVKFIDNPADVLCPDLALLLRDREINYSNKMRFFALCLIVHLRIWDLENMILSAFQNP